MLSTLASVKRVLSVVGTNAQDYGAARGLSARAMGAQSDGLVAIRNAYVWGSARAYVHRSHSGAYGLVNSEEAYQNLRRFLFGALRGIALVVVGFIVYDRAVADQAVPMIDNSRTAKVVANFQSKIDENIPTDAPGWIVERFNELTAVCATEGALPQVTPLAPDAAPATGG